MEKVSFKKMEEGTAAEYAFLDRLEDQFKHGLAKRLIMQLEQLEHSLSGYQVSRLEHCLQAASRAHRAGEDEEVIVAALLHDIGDELAPYSHSELAAAVLRPFVSEKVYWVIKHHGVFQMYYYAHHCGGDRHARDIYKDHPYYDDAVHFCHNYDQNCFDPDYESYPLSFFEPILERFFATPRLDDDEHIARYGHQV